MKIIELNNFKIADDKLTILAGPCAIENEEVVFETAKKLKEICKELDINFVFNASYDKANRSSINSYRGLGIDEGIRILKKVKEELNLPIVTDFHTPEQAHIAAQVADIIQIPAFLCRQTDILVEAAKTGKIVNIKKGQFLAPNQMKSAIQKIVDSGNDKILITERGTTFGYNNLVVDFRSIPIIQEMGFPVVFDATHSVQIPAGHGDSTSGERKYVEMLAKSAITSGVKVLFFEIHPDPQNAKCDGDNMIPLNDAKRVFSNLKALFELNKTLV